MSSENKKVFHYQKVELEDELEEEDVILASRTMEGERAKLSSELGSRKPRGRGRLKVWCLLLLVTLITGAASSTQSISNRTIERSPPPPLLKTTRASVRTTNVSMSKQEKTQKPEATSSSTTTSGATTSTVNAVVTHKPEWYQKYWEKYANPHRWDWLLLGLVGGISLSIGLAGILCMYCMCRSRRKMRRKHFERLLKDINASEKFSLVNSSDDEDDSESESHVHHSISNK